MNEQFPLPREPQPEIIPTEKAPEISHIPPEVVNEIIQKITDEEQQEKEREQEINEIIRRKKP